MIKLQKLVHLNIYKLKLKEQLKIIQTIQLEYKQIQLIQITRAENNTSRGYIKGELISD